MAFEDNILLSIKREYTKDEKVGLLVEKIKGLEFENGVLKSEIAETEHNAKISKLIAEKERVKSLEKIYYLEKESRKYKKNYYVIRKMNALMKIFLADLIEAKHYLSFMKILTKKQIEYNGHYDKSREAQDNIKKQCEHSN